MANKRIVLSKFDEQVLYAEVNGICPICAKSLHHKKAGKVAANYDKAHLYPLNPLPEELVILKDVRRLGENVNSVENYILLCKACHFKFDHPRTLEEYNELFAIKEKLIYENRMRMEYSQYKLEEDLKSVIHMLANNQSEYSGQLRFDAKKVDEKANTTMSPLLKRQIKSDVVDYFEYIREQFAELERTQEHRFDLIAIQIKAFYRQCRIESSSQDVIFNTIVNWIDIKTNKKSPYACRILASFFVQNCEVF